MDDFFKRLGLNAKESETFVRLLELGAQPVSIIAKQVGLPRTSMYFVVEKLKKAQLVDEFERKGVTFVRCIPAKNIEDVLKNRERELEQTKQLFLETLPSLTAMESTMSITPKATFFEGKVEVMRMYAQIVKELSFCAFVDLASVKKCMPEYHEEIPKMIKAGGGKARELVIDSPEARRYRKEYKSRLHQIRFLPKTMSFTSDIIICTDHIYMTAYDNDRVASVQMFSAPLAKTHQTLFDALWVQGIED
jgi:sugar-specific transcriptional regulator TrmB